MKFSDYKENKQHGSNDFPMQYYYVSATHSQYVMPLHWHRELEILRVREGELLLYLNNEEYRLKANDIAFIAPGTLHRGDPIGCTYECAVFDMRITAGYTNNRVSEMIQPIIASDVELSPLCAEAESAAASLFDCLASEDEYYELNASALVAGIIYELYKGGAVKPFQRENKRLAHRRAAMALLIDKIEKEYTHKITLADLAEMTQINEKYLCRFFKEFTGQTPIDYINRLRIDRACYDMTVNKMNVTEAAYESGFNELSYFSKIFKKYKGITPGQYKQRFAFQ